MPAQCTAPPIARSSVTSSRSGTGGAASRACPPGPGGGSGSPGAGCGSSRVERCERALVEQAHRAPPCSEIGRSRARCVVHARSCTSTPSSSPASCGQVVGGRHVESASGGARRRARSSPSRARRASRAPRPGSRPPPAPAGRAPPRGRAWRSRASGPRASNIRSNSAARSPRSRSWPGSARAGANVSITNCGGALSHSIVTSEIGTSRPGERLHERHGQQVARQSSACCGSAAGATRPCGSTCR